MTTTRTFNGVQFTRATEAETRDAGAEKLWFAFNGRFEVRADENCERPSELEWGVWDREADDWADGGNGVFPNTLAACADVISRTVVNG